jgi:hypothetical protein
MTRLDIQERPDRQLRRAVLGLRGFIPRAASAHCIFPFEEIGANVGPSPEPLLRSCSDLRPDDHVRRKPELSLRLWPALDQRPAVETLAWPPERDDLGALSFLDASLEDDEEAFGRGVPGEDRLAGPEIADIGRRPHDFGLGGRKSVERRVRQVESLHHPSLPIAAGPSWPAKRPLRLRPPDRIWQLANRRGPSRETGAIPGGASSATPAAFSAFGGQKIR